MGLIGLAAFSWALRNDQFEDPEGDAWRIVVPENPPDKERTPDDELAPSPQTAAPEEGYELAVKSARVAIKMTQSDAAVREKLRAIYAEDAAALIASSQVVAMHFTAVAAVNNFWRETQ